MNVRKGFSAVLMVGLVAAGVGLLFAQVVLAAALPMPPKGARSLPVPYPSDVLRPSGARSVVAGQDAPGDRVYNNDVDPITAFYPPDAGDVMADDLALAGGACNVVYYEIGVIGFSGEGSPETFSVDLALWNGDPCDFPTSQPIAGTEQTIADIPQDSLPKLIAVTLDAPTAVPGAVFLAATFSNDNAGWLVAGPAEVGSTQDTWSEDDFVQGCGLFSFVEDLYGGFYANVHCDLGGQALGACCDGTSCTQTTEANCTTGVWKGAFTTCEPNVCVPGTCCTGASFDQCANSTAAGCADGVFTAEATCLEGCPANFKLYENDFRTGLFSGVDPNTKFADDLTFAPGTPCDLLAYDVTMFGVEGGSATFDTEVELWTNNDRSTPNDPEDDIPGVPIAGTRRLFSRIPADGFAKRLFVSGFSGVSLPPQAWIVVDTNTDQAGPALAGVADIGFSQDLFAIFNDAGTNVWNPGFHFGGFDPSGCPGPFPACTPAGSFRVNVWCAGDEPTGACCDRHAGTCTEGVTFADCSGRWVEGGTCDPETFNPPCGTHACCQRAPFNPDVILCINQTPEECSMADDGFLSRGLFCDDIDCQILDDAACNCPPGGCLGLTGDCLQQHGTPGCEDPFCSCTVCGRPGGSFCCTNFWTSECVDDAEEFCTLGNNDLCPEAKRISGTGVFSFDNLQAGRDGPPHPACPSAGGNDIDRDLWFAWNSPCTAPVFIGTCERTFVDTKIAVYEGTACPPSFESLQACNDDLCVRQSMLSFSAVSGQDYLIRVGSSPGQIGGDGMFLITCGPPNNASCPVAGQDCCAANSSGGCSQESCCETVCACDPYCCQTEWDSQCGSFGFEGGGCGAAALCLDSCAGGCPVGDSEVLSMPNPIVDARRPLGGALGLDQVVMLAPAGAGQPCFDVCETASSNGANDIGDFSNVAGLYTIELLRPITPSAVTTVTYSDVLDGSTSAILISHPGNVNGDGFADSDDVVDLVDALLGAPPEGGLVSTDIDGSGLLTPLDLWDLVNGLNGVGEPPWDGTARPTYVGICP